MKTFNLFLALLFSASMIAQIQDVEIKPASDSTFYISSGTEETPEGVDSAGMVTQLLELIREKENEYGARLYREYKANRESRNATRALNQFTDGSTFDTTFVKYAKVIYLNRYNGEWRMAGDTTIDNIIVNNNLSVVGDPARIIPMANSYFIYRNSFAVEDLYFFRDISAPRRRYIAISSAGNVYRLIKM